MTVQAEESRVLDPGRKQSVRERVRDRLLKKPDRPEKVKDEDFEREKGLEDFLRSPSDEDVLPSFPSPYRKPVPRINISSSPRWPSAQELLRAQKNALLGEKDHKINSSSISSRRKKKKRKEGLAVRFADAAPQVIGEGGDEAEAPTLHISQNRHMSPAYKPQELDSDPSSNNIRPRILARAPTGWGDMPKEKKVDGTKVSLENATTARSDVPPGLEYLDPLSAGTQRRMREEEGRAFTTGLQDPSPDPTCPERHSLHEPDPGFPRPSLTRGPNQHQASSNASPDRLNNSSPASRPSSSSSHYSLPETSPPEKIHEQQTTSDHAAPQIVMSPPGGPLLHDVAHHSEEDPLSEFRLRARRYYGIFALSVEIGRDSSDVSLSQWIRAATWWFLTAETTFKQLRRDLQDGVDMKRIMSSRRLTQAMVDLAKTAWIVEDVVSDYAEKKAIDLSSPASVDGLIQSSPNSRLSRTLQYWQDLSKRLGSLAAAVQRSGFMASTSEEVPLSSGVDSTIWVSYSNRDSRISSWLRAANPPWVLMDDSMVPEEPFDLAHVMPLRSSGKIFRIRSMFCHVSGNFRDDRQSANMPCVLTVGRRSGSYALVLFVASQDHGVNVVIETAPLHGDGMEWQHGNSSVLFNFADGFQFLIQFQQPDYSQFKERYDLSLRALMTAAGRDESMAANAGERLIYRATCASFERKSNQKISTFNCEGAQWDCELLLFEKYITPKGTPIARKLHQGLRLRVLLSPFAPNLGILDAHLGGDKPILVHARDELVPPRLEVLEIHRASLIIQFSRHGDLSRFQDLLASPNHAWRGSNPERMMLRSFSIQPFSASAQDLLCRAKWQHVQISAQRVQSQGQYRPDDIEAAPSINICLTSREIVMAERLFQGQSQIRWGLSVGNLASLSVWHAAQQEASMLLRYKLAAANAPVIADQMLANLKQCASIHKYTFTCQADLHLFQKHLTGARVVFDGLASSFTVTRGASLRSKKDELGIARVQLLYFDRPQPQQLWYMVAFFEQGGQVITLPLDVSDQFEKTHHGKGKYGIRLVEARVRLSPSSSSSSPPLQLDSPSQLDQTSPHDEASSSKGLVCIHPQVGAVPGSESGAGGGGDEERRDVVIVFDAEEGQEEFAQVLSTTSAKKSSSSSSFRDVLHFR